MNIKKIIIALISFLIICLISCGVYIVFFKEDQDSTLTLIEKQWIEDNKNNVIDLNIVNNVPIFNLDGTGVIFDFINSLEENTGLEFNKISYSNELNSNSGYVFSLKDAKEENDITIYEDNYAIISKAKIRYNNIFDIEEQTVYGVLEDDLEKINNCLKENDNISLKTYEDVLDIIEDLESGKISATVLPKTIYLNEIFENELYINYNLNLKKYLVLELGDTEKLNTIIKKYFDKWYKENYDTSYSTYFQDYYFDANDITDDEKVNFESKQYKYGFVANAPYDMLNDGKLVGINSEIIKSFTTLTGIEMKYYEYNNAEALIDKFNDNDLDIYFNTYDNDKYDMDILETISFAKEEIVVLNNVNSRIDIDSISSLQNKKIMTLKSSKIGKELKNKNIDIKEYKTVDELLNNLDESYLIVIDKETYNTYKNSKLIDYIDIYTFYLDDSYNYIIRDIKDNKIFMNYFNFYLSFINYNDIIKNIDYNDFNIKNTDFIIEFLIAVCVIVIIIILTMIFIKNKKINKNKNNQVSKENRIKYIDVLTSLKNRNYLNDSIEKWDESEIYPQAIVIADLNNIAYINDNYGHSEGDNVIKEAANILFKTQIENSEIMRTNGNEFLIYLVEYDEKQVVSYIRKLNREFKELSHGFGAAIGYSMILDPLKTIDDAINEATLDMRTNKEESK